MRRRIWSARDATDTGAVDGAGDGQSPAQRHPPVDRVEELLAMLDGGEGNTPCSVGVPPWFLSAAHTRLADMTRGTEYAEKVEIAFAAGGPSNARVSPDKLALALAAIDEQFQGEIRSLSVAHAGSQVD